MLPPANLEASLQADSELADSELLAAYRRTGDRGALDELLARYVGKTRALAAKLVLDGTLADDVAQEAMVRAITKIDSFAGRSEFSTWLYRITVNVAKDHLRKRQKSDDAAALDEVPASTHSGPEQQAIDSEMMERVNREMASLSPALRIAIVLTSVEGLSAPQAAQIAGCSTPTMHWRVHRARKLLKTRLARYLP